MKEGTISDLTDKSALRDILREHGWSRDESRGVWSIDEGSNIIVDVTKGAQYLHEVREMIVAGYRWGLKEGPIAYEHVRGLKAKVVDVELHEDPVHRGPAQIMPCSRRAMFAAFLTGSPALMEPIQKITAKISSDLVGEVTSVITQKRGKVISVEQKEHLVYITGEIPTAETFDLSEVLRGATSGRALWGLEFLKWAPIPASLLAKIIKEVRERKGLSPNPPKAQEFIDKV
jgi:elongation factor 2